MGLGKPTKLRIAFLNSVAIGVIGLGIALQACSDEDADEVGRDLQEQAEERRDRLLTQMDEVKRDIAEDASGVAVDNIRDVDINDDQAVVKTDLDADKTKQANDLCRAAIKNPVLSVNTARVEGKKGRVLATCQESS